MNWTETYTDPNTIEPSIENNGSSLLQTDRYILGEPVTNGSSLLQTDRYILGEPVFWSYISLTGIEATMAIVGNLITLVAVYKYEFLRKNVACLFIASLALADCMGGLGLLIIIARNTVNISWLLVVISLCKAELFFVLLSTLGNIYSYLLLTVDRFFYIERPLRYNSIMTQRRALHAIVIIWIPIMIQTSTSIVWELDPNEGVACYFSYESIFRKGAEYSLLIQRFVISFCVLLPIYGKVTHTTLNLIQTDPHLSNFPPGSQAQQRRKIQERKLTLTIAITFGTYLLCNIPGPIYAATVSQIYTLSLPFGILLGWRILFLVLMLQTVLNPFIYVKKNALLRTAYRKMFLKQNVDPEFPGIDLPQY